MPTTSYMISEPLHASDFLTDADVARLTRDMYDGRTIGGDLCDVTYSQLRRDADGRLIFDDLEITTRLGFYGDADARDMAIQTLKEDCAAIGVLSALA